MTTGNIQMFEIPLASRMPFEQIALKLNPADDVAIAKTPITPGVTITRAGAPDIAIRHLIPSGHKFALKPPPSAARSAATGRSSVLPPGPSSRAITSTPTTCRRRLRPRLRLLHRVHPVEFVPVDQRRTFMGYLRADGRVGTRNLIAVARQRQLLGVTSSSRSPHYFTPERLAAYPNVDGVIAVTHGSGCGLRVRRRRTTRSCSAPSPGWRGIATSALT